MEFSEEKAKQIVEKFGLSPKTILVWKTRNAIPNRYAQPDYTPKQDLTPAYLKSEERVIKAFKSPGLRVSVILQQEGIDKIDFYDANRTDGKRRHMQPEQVLKLKKNLQELRIKVKSVIEPLAGKKLFTDRQKENVNNLLLDERFAVLGVLPEVLIYERWIGRNRKTVRTYTYEDFECEYMVDRLSIFLLQTAMQ